LWLLCGGAGTENKRATRKVVKVWYNMHVLYCVWDRVKLLCESIQLY
jgi:hypothetical protein